MAAGPDAGRQVDQPVVACWLNLQEAWWRLLRREAFAGQTFADHEEIEQAVGGAAVASCTTYEERSTS